MYLTSGNDTVDMIGEINFTGNVIPELWYRNILRENGKPNLNAIIILSDIIYWYRPEMIRDENSGQIIGMRKKFKEDALQRSYAQIATKFGMSEREATNAVVALEKMGLVKRDLRTIEVGNEGRRLNNVLYILINPERIKEITFSILEESQITENTPVTLKSDRCHFEKGEPVTLESDSSHFKKREAVTIAMDDINSYRSAAGVAPVIWSDGLYAAAMIRAKQISESGDYGHLHDIGGEIHAQTSLAAIAVSAWKQSAGHYEYMVEEGFINCAVATYGNCTIAMFGYASPILMNDWVFDEKIPAVENIFDGNTTLQEYERTHYPNEYADFFVPVAPEKVCSDYQERLNRYARKWEEISGLTYPKM